MFGYYGDWGLMGGGFMFMALLCGLFIIGLVFLVEWLFQQGNIKSSDEPALDILQKRYAKGEINKKEFNERKKGIMEK